ncbi:MAG TPA: hypothetical protein VKY57_10405 [Chitinispirillaceae bacterium]|nr:hypothetical protein [Fibrobacter sp.]HLV31969.1 hypothetical protein [Chitinispirillaceae bacterium]
MNIWITMDNQTLITELQQNNIEKIPQIPDLRKSDYVIICFLNGIYIQITFEM